MVKMGFMLAYERAECRSCRWFREKLPFEERLKVPPNLDAVGKCKRNGNIIKMGAQKTQSFSSGMNGQSLSICMDIWDVPMTYEPCVGRGETGDNSPCLNETHGMGET